MHPHALQPKGTPAPKGIQCPPTHAIPGTQGCTLVPSRPWGLSAPKETKRPPKPCGPWHPRVHPHVLQPKGTPVPKGTQCPPNSRGPQHPRVHPNALQLKGTPSTQRHTTPTQPMRSLAPKGAPRCPPTPRGSQHPKVPPPPIPTHPHTPPCRVLAERQRHVEEDQQVADSKHRQILRRGAAQLVLQGALQGGMELRGTPAPMGAPKTPP